MSITFEKESGRINIQHINCFCMKGLYIVMQLPSAIVYFSLFDDGPIDTQILALMTGSQCIVSDTQMNVKARGHFVY